MKVLAEECSCAPVSLTTSHGKMRQSHHPTPWLIHQFTYTQATCAINWQACVCVCVSAYKPNLHCLIAEHIVPSLVNANLICREADVLYRETTKHSHRYTHPASIPALTVTDPLADKTPHPSGRAWYWGPPSSPSRTPKTHTHPSHTLHWGGLQLHAQTPHIAVRKPLHPYKCRHFLSLSLSIIAHSLPPSLSQHLSSFPQQPHSQSDGRWHHSVAASAEAGLWMCVCDGREKGRARHTQGHSRNINRAVSLPDQLT